MTAQMTTALPSEMDVQLPLDPTTDNAEHVATLLRRVLGLVEDFSEHQHASAADVVQALTVATALRSAMAELDDEPDPVLGPTRLVDVAVQGQPLRAA